MVNAAVKDAVTAATRCPPGGDAAEDRRAGHQWLLGLQADRPADHDRGKFQVAKRLEEITGVHRARH
ncbi:hypothetical protein AAVH_11706 [Aphelenchoides avenae]|nr:hypothetical protein AAVH_11706 [Aphelenchus avenae]